jgi:hypothetical protein
VLLFYIPRLCSPCCDIHLVMDATIRLPVFSSSRGRVSSSHSTSTFLVLKNPARWARLSTLSAHQVTSNIIWQPTLGDPGAHRLGASKPRKKRGLNVANLRERVYFQIWSITCYWDAVWGGECEGVRGPGRDVAGQIGDRSSRSRSELALKRRRMYRRSK